MYRTQCMWKITNYVPDGPKQQVMLHKINMKTRHHLFPSEITERDIFQAKSLSIYRKNNFPPTLVQRILFYSL